MVNAKICLFFHILCAYVTVRAFARVSACVRTCTCVCGMTYAQRRIFVGKRNTQKIRDC